MKPYFSRHDYFSAPAEEDLTPVTIMDSITQTMRALDIAYAGFDNAVDFDMIDSYIYQINSLQLRYKHLTDLAASDPNAVLPTLVETVIPKRVGAV
jgi:hypothetical protein